MKTFFNQQVKNVLRTNENIRKISNGHEDDYNWLFARLPLFQKMCKLVAIDLNKQQARDADPKAIQQINFTENLERDRHTTIFFNIKEAKETIFDFSQGTMRVF